MKKKKSLVPVFMVVLADLIGFGIVLPLLPYYAKTFSASALMVGLLYSVYSLGQLIFSPMWGSYSDRIGRRPVMIISTLGSVGAYIMFGLAQSLFVLFLSRIIAGIMGGNISAAKAYVTDITTKENRAKGMGMIGAAFGIGFVVGPGIAGLLISDMFHHFIAHIGLSSFASWMQANKYAIPGFFAAFLSLISNLLVIFKLPETVDTSAPRPASNRPKRHTVFSRQFWATVFNQNGADSRGLLLPLFGAYFLLAFGQASLYSAFPLFSQSNLGLTIEQVSLQFFWIGLIAAFIQGGLIRHLTDYVKEEKLFFAGSIFMVIGIGVIPLADSLLTLSIYLGILAVGLSLVQPTILSLVSQEAEEQNIGAVMGTQQSVQGLGRMIGPAWGGFLFGISAGLPFYATAIVLAGIIFIGLKVVRHAVVNEPVAAE